MNFIRRLPPFEYLAPSSLEEALKLLERYRGKAKLLAGGTDLLIQMKERKVMPEYVIGLKNIPGLDKIEAADGGLRIGALATHQTIAASSLVKERFACLAQACRKIASPQIRSIATIGGNICNAGPSADSAPALLALDARIKVVSRRAEKDLPLDRFLVAPFQTSLSQTALVAGIFVPFPPSGSATSYRYLTKRTEIDETLVGAAVKLTLDGHGKCSEAAIGLCSVAPAPFRARSAESLLKGKEVTPALVERAAWTAAAETTPRSRAGYRREMTAVMVSRALTDCIQQIKNQNATIASLPGD